MTGKIADIIHNRQKKRVNLSEGRKKRKVQGGKNLIDVV